MSWRGWQPGDVAMVTALTRPTEYRAFYDGETWCEAGAGEFCVDEPFSHRPLVVIDPEDREQVERLTSIFMDDHNTGDEPEDMRLTLHDFIAPPKPPEPTGLGAVVEDAGGNRFTRVGTDSIAPWYAEGPRDTGRPYRYFADIAAIKVLSEGVTS